MSRTRKEKLDDPTDISLQVVLENYTEDCTVAAADVCNSDNALEKRKKEANTPLYLKRV